MIIFKDVKRKKSLGKPKEASVGVSVRTWVEVTSAEYVKDDKGKQKKSSGGNNVIKINTVVRDNIKTNDGKQMVIPTFMNATYYETDYSPKLKDIKPTDKLKKYAEVSFNTGGLPNEGRDSVFGNFKVRNYESQDGSPKNSISIYGANVKKALKSDETYTIEDYDGTKLVFEVDKQIKPVIKGFIKSISNTENFVENNYNEDLKTLDFDVYYLENSNEDTKYDTIMPMRLENIEKEKMMDFVKFVKSNENKVIRFSGHVKSYAIKKEIEETESSGFGEFSYGGFETIGYEARMVVNYIEDKKNWDIQITDNTGKVVTGDVEQELPVSEDFVF